MAKLMWVLWGYLICQILKGATFSYDVSLWCTITHWKDVDEKETLVGLGKPITTLSLQK